MQIMTQPIFSRFLFILQLFVYSAIVSAAIKYIAPSFSLLNGLTQDQINAIALYSITTPVALFGFVLWLNR
jgi:hypothetical protein